MWHKMMTVAFLTNGLGIFGTRVLTGWGWAEFYKFQYLVFWYGSGLLFALLLFWRERISLTRRDFVIGGLMGAASVGGQFSLLSALENGIPGHIAFPLAIKCHSIVESHKCQSIVEHAREATSRAKQERAFAHSCQALRKSSASQGSRLMRLAQPLTCTALEQS